MIFPFSEKGMRKTRSLTAKPTLLSQYNFCVIVELQLFRTPFKLKPIKMEQQLHNGFMLMQSLFF